MKGIGTIVIDCGSDTCKAGFAGEPSPPFVFSVAENSHVNRGIVSNWQELESILHRVFETELKINPAEYSILLTEDPMNPRENRENTTQIMFETFNVSSFFLAIQSVLSLYSAGRTNGLVVDIGHGASHIVPVYNGYAIAHANAQFGVTGCDLTCYLDKLLSDRGISLTNAQLRSLKENLCCVSQNYSAELTKAEEIQFALADGETITVGHERFSCPEMLMDPSLAGFATDGLGKVISECISACNASISKHVYNNIILSGGSSLFAGLDQRLHSELVGLTGLQIRNVVAPRQRKFGAWIGGSCLASLPTFAGMVISRDEYNESGPSIVHRKCPQH